jgi:hypothetical protein
VFAALQAVVAPPLAAALTGSGLYQVLLEGALLLLAVDPAAYSQAPDVQLQLSEGLGIATRAAIEVTQSLAPLCVIRVQATQPNQSTTTFTHTAPSSCTVMLPAQQGSVQAHGSQQMVLHAPACILASQPVPPSAFLLQRHACPNTMACASHPTAG